MHDYKFGRNKILTLSLWMIMPYIDANGFSTFVSKYNDYVGMLIELIGSSRP